MVTAPSGSGADSQPFFRMMNPWTQGKRHDNNCDYVKAWIPELESVPSEDIHDWQNKYDEYGVNLNIMALEYLSR